MKCRLTILMFLLCFRTAAQPSPAHRIAYISELVFFIETTLLLPESVTYLSDSAVEIKIPVVSQRLRLGIPTQDTTYSLIRRVDYRRKWKRPALKEVEFQLIGESNGAAPWRKLIQSSGSSGHPLVILMDTLLPERRQSGIRFRTTRGHIFLTVRTEHRPMAPLVSLYRQTAPGDTTIKSLRASIAARQLPEAFHRLRKNTIHLDAGNFLELIFEDHALVTDSSVEYRLRTGDDEGRWMRTGRFALLKELKSDQVYTLDIKYPGSEKINSYQIAVSPRWYEKTMTLVLLALVILVLGIITGFTWLRLRWNKERRKKDQLQYRLKAVQAQLNPHFIFNALSSIQALVNTDKKEEANLYLTSFSTVLRMALKNSDAVFSPLSSEIELLRNYLYIEQLRFQFHFDIWIDESLDLSGIEVPPMLFQPSIENAIKHGVAGKGKQGLVLLSVTRRSNGFSVNIFDNGKWQDGRPEGYGISLTRKRVIAANGLDRERKITYEIDKGRAGTAVRFGFKNWFL